MGAGIAACSLILPIPAPMSIHTKPAPKNAYATWDRGVRKSMDDFKTDYSAILIKIAADEKETTFRVRTCLPYA